MACIILLLLDALSHAPQVRRDIHQGDASVVHKALAGIQMRAVTGCRQQAELGGGLAAPGQVEREAGHGYSGCTQGGAGHPAPDCQGGRPGGLPRVWQHPPGRLRALPRALLRRVPP